jgi:hypothetical protein
MFHFSLNLIVHTPSRPQTTSQSRGICHTLHCPCYHNAFVETRTLALSILEAKYECTRTLALKVLMWFLLSLVAMARLAYDMCLRIDNRWLWIDDIVTVLGPDSQSTLWGRLSFLSLSQAYREYSFSQPPSPPESVQV